MPPDTQPRELPEEAVEAARDGYYSYKTEGDRLANALNAAIDASPRLHLLPEGSYEELVERVARVLAGPDEQSEWEWYRSDAQEALAVLNITEAEPDA